VDRDDEAFSTEAVLASLLADTLTDDRWWAKFAASPNESRWSEALADRAVHLYRQTFPVIETRLGKEPAPVDQGLAVLREIADAAAMRSSQWALTQPEPVYIATREVIELFVRLYEVDQEVVP
jgi:hypothetical protein